LPLKIEMFKRENRLVSGIRFANSCLLNTPQFVLKEKKNGLDLNRFGIIVSKKIDKRAVGRNKVKRFFRETLLNLEQKMNAGHDILLIIKKRTIDKEKNVDGLAVEQALIKAGVILK
jgi:ribonuclease P protein component